MTAETGYSIVDACPGLAGLTGRAWALAHNVRPIPANQYRQMHYHPRAAYDRAWRNVFFILAKEAKIPPLPAAVIIADQFVDKPPMPDPGALAPTLKAAIDGIVDAGVLPDDTATYLRFVGMNPPELRRTDRLIITVLESEPRQ